MSKFTVLIESADATMRAEVSAYEAVGEETAVAEVLALHASADPVLVSVAESFD